jgi:nucleoside-diphosphate-sugar epimerase
MKIAILGAPGCVGRNLIKKLLESPEYEIIASYREKQDAVENIRDTSQIFLELFNPLK